MFKRHMCFAGLSLLALVAGGAIAQPAKAPVEAVKPRAGANPAPARAAGEGAGPFRKMVIRGVNLIDTAPAYGYSEERVGDALRKSRKDWVISTKVGEEFTPDKFSTQGHSHFDFSAQHTRRSVERSLRRLRTDYLDLVLIHSDGNDLDILQHTEVLHTLQQLKQEGWIRAVGISSKTLEGGLLAAEVCDAVMVTYNAGQQDEAPVIAKSAQHGAAVLLKKVLASGHICHDAPAPDANRPTQDPIQRALDFAYAPPFSRTWDVLNVAGNVAK